MDTIADKIMRAQRRSFFRSRPVFDRFSDVTDEELCELETRIKCKLPASLRQWLLIAGYGDINESLSFRENWFQMIDRGQLEGSIIFAQDILGSFYAFNPHNEEIFYISRSHHAYASVASNFLSFMQELITRDYQIEQWMDSLDFEKYDWKS
jgi:hypothetical protein